MIGVKGQYIFVFSIKYGSVVLQDFIKEANLHTFTLIEEAGNVLPTFELAFDIDSPEVLPYLNEGNTLQVSFGRSTEDKELMESELSILKLEYTRRGESKYAVYINGVYSALKYLSEDLVKQYASISGVEAIKQVADLHFNTDFNITKSQDSQTWLRPNVSAKRFVNDTWMHSYIKDSFIGIGIDSKGTFILKDMKLEIADTGKSPRFRFTTKPKEAKDILYDGDYSVGSNTGFMNYWMGYGRERRIFDMEDGVDFDVLTSESLLLTSAKSFTRTSDVTKKVSEVRFDNDNIHSKYWEAYHSNLQNLALFSSHRISVSFHMEYKPIRILDVVSFSDIELNTVTQADASAGKYFVSKVSRNLSSKTFVTTCQLCRESITGVQGELR